MNGYFFDDLDYERKEFDITQYAGPAGDFMAYIRCGEHSCDVYYAEVLAG